MKEVKHEHQREMIFSDDMAFYATPEYQRYRKAWNERPVAQDCEVDPPRFLAQIGDADAG